MSKRKKSRSDAQQSFEPEAISLLGQKLGILLNRKTIKLDGCSMQVDGYGEEAEGLHIHLAEAWARIGAAKGAQPKKVLSDVLKLAYLAEAIAADRPDVVISKHIVFVDDAAAKVLQGNKWGANAAHAFGVQSHTVRLTSVSQEAILTAQSEQDIRNGS